MSPPPSRSSVIRSSSAAGIPPARRVACRPASTAASGAETYERVHHHAPAALAAACARGAIRLVHVSALGLHAGALSGFLTSKLAGERAIAACGSNYSIVRPSLL